ncbi:MAG: hypothetical protein NT068_01440 [Candidatus Nomurabacteria bacterium]|nr:hypothetical protein [Candidatus Nomurabacteria bacterium]
MAKNKSKNTPWSDLTDNFKNYLFEDHPELLPKGFKEVTPKNEIQLLFEEEVNRAGKSPIVFPSLEITESICDHFSNGHLLPVYAPGRNKEKNFFSKNVKGR